MDPLAWVPPAVMWDWIQLGRLFVLQSLLVGWVCQLMPPCLPHSLMSLRSTHSHAYTHFASCFIFMLFPHLVFNEIRVWIKICHNTSPSISSEPQQSCLDVCIFYFLPLHWWIIWSNIWAQSQQPHTLYRKKKSIFTISLLYNISAAKDRMVNVADAGVMDTLVAKVKIECGCRLNNIETSLFVLWAFAFYA